MICGVWADYFGFAGLVNFVVGLCYEFCNFCVLLVWGLLIFDLILIVWGLFGAVGCLWLFYFIYFWWL